MKPLLCIPARDPKRSQVLNLRSVAWASVPVAVGGCGSPHGGAGASTSLDAWRAYHRAVIADLESIALRGSAATRSQDFAMVGSICTEGMVVATAEAGPAAPDAELQRHYSLMEKSYEAGFSTCAAGTPASFERSLPSLDKGNEELRAATARLMKLAPR